MNQNKWRVSSVIWWCLIVYISVACVTSAIRHPWMTEVEAWMHIDDILMFREISYKEVRDKYINGK